MNRVLHRPRHDEAALLDATVHAAPAAHLRQADRDNRPVSFDDLDFNASAEMPHGWTPARGADKLDHRAVRNEIARLHDRAMHDAFQRPAPTGVPYGARVREVPLGSVRHDETPVAERLARIGLVYAKRGTTAVGQLAEVSAR